MYNHYPETGYFTLYGFFTKESDTLLYVGVTKSLVKTRCSRHSKWDKVTMYHKEIMFFPTRKEAEEWETYFINYFKLQEVGLNEATGPGTTGVKQSKEWIQKKVEARAGYRCSKDTILNMRESKRHKMHRVRCNETGKEYESIAAASRDTGIHTSKISQIVRGKRKSAKGYTFVRID